MSKESSTILNEIQALLRACWNRKIVERVAVGLVLLMICTASGFVLLLTLEMNLWMPTLWRSSLFWAWIVASMILLIWAVLRPGLMGWLTRSRYRRIAREVTKDQPLLQNQLVCLLELCNGNASQSPPPLIDRAVKSLEEDVSAQSLDMSINWNQPMAWSRYAAIPLGLITILILAAPQGFQDASVRLFSPGKSFESPAPFSLTVTSGHIEVAKGDSVTLSAMATGVALPAIVAFELSVDGERAIRSENAQIDSLDRFLHREKNLRLSQRYRARSGSITSDWYKITVLDRPVLRNLQVTLRPPTYTGLPETQLPLGIGDISALQGTTASVRVRSSIPDAHAWLSFDSERQDLALEDFAGTIIVRDETSYRILLESSSGVRNIDPITYSVMPILDQYPSVELLSPDDHADLNDQLLIPLIIRVQDDYGFSRFTLSWSLTESRFGDTMESYQELVLPLPLTPEIEYSWDIDLTTGLDIVPGDVISYFLTIWDNDGYNGPKKNSTITHKLRLPSITEKYEVLESTQNETESGLESLLDDAELVREQFNELQDELRRKQDASWDDRQNLEGLQESLEEIQTRVDNLADNMSEAAQQMDDHSLVSDELLDLFEELQDVTEEIHSPELMEALQELQEAVSELDPAAMQESLEKFEFNEEMFRERMERTLELFKNFQVQQQLEEAARRAEDLKQVQENLSEQTEQNPPAENVNDLIDEQQFSSEEMTALEEKLEEIRDRMEELRNAPVSQMEQLNQETQAKELPEKMQQNAQQMESGNMQQANQEQQMMSQSMEQLQSDLQNVQSGMGGQQMSINLAALKLILSNVLRLSHDQEGLRRQIAGATRESPLLRDFAREQSILNVGGRVVADSLRSLGRSVPQLSRDVLQFAGNVLIHMSAATDALTDRDSNSAESHAIQAMTSLNELALLLSDLLNQLMNSSSSNSGSGMSMEQMIQQLQQMAKQQSRLNQALQDFFGREPGERLSADMQERLQQLAAQQEAMRRQLTELAKERDLANQLAGNLERIAQQMEESIQEFQSGQISRPTKQRQQQILTRLLDASRSLQERGRERRREGRQGVETERRSPESLQESMSKDELRRALINALESGYARDYQLLIQRYFDLLQNR